MARVYNLPYKLTLQEKRYAKRHPRKCPYSTCHSENVLETGTTFEYGGLRQDMTCCDCRGVWKLILTVDSVDDREG